MYYGRRLRNSPIMRQALAQVQLRAQDLIQPYFVTNNPRDKIAINSMPGIYNYGINNLLPDVERSLSLGIKHILLFGVGDAKHDNAHMAYNDNNAVIKAIKKLKKQFGNDLFITTDICLCAYTTHGHCGIIKNEKIDQKSTLHILDKIAISHVAAGADMVAPSDMMDMSVNSIRSALDQHKYYDTPIMSYTSKYASAYYGPFRDAAHSSPQYGDRKSYQMDYRNANGYIKEILADEQEGVDIIMVKPALAYLDIISKSRAMTSLPLAAYNVSGEYCMVKAAAGNGWLDESQIVYENLIAIKRAGADMIISYHAQEALLNNWI